VRFDYAVRIIMAAVAPLTFGINKAMAIGFILYFLYGPATGQSLEKLWLLEVVGCTLYVTPFAQFFVW
jgi:xanthine/uracil/vitamin C permease (AzgA family)